MREAYPKSFMTFPTTSTAPTAITQSARQNLLSIRNLAKTFGRNEVLRDVSLEIAEGEFLTILGESGSGKTTALVARFVHHVEEGAAPDAVAVLAPTESAAGGLRRPQRRSRSG